MLVVKTPLRLTFGGGGTDIPSYYSSFGGFSITAAIDKYVYIIAHDRFERNYRISYSKTEIVDRIVDVQHPLVREALGLVGPIEKIELVSIADLPAKTGLGSSGAFTVGLLNALHLYQKEHLPPSALAEEACQITMEKLKEPSGKQDEYSAAYGGINSYAISTDGTVHVSPLQVSKATVSQLQNQLLLFYTGITRESRIILESQYKAAASSDQNVIHCLHKIKQIGVDSKNAIETGDLQQFGSLLDSHWKTKKQMAPNATTPEIDALYKLATENGATGGKIMGAGGGGFFMFHCDSNQRKLIEILNHHGLTQLDFKFEYEGSKVIANL
jgi:D-glycero-alpha-D-manno-heptose-7-phosphate kinase